MSKHFRVPGRLAARLRELGIDAPTMLKSAGLPPGLLGQPRVLVTTEELFRLWRAIGQASPDPAVGLALGTEHRPEHFDAIALAVLANESFGEGMRQMARYKLLSCPEEIIQETVADEWSIQFRWLLGNNDEPQVLTDLCFAWVLTIARRGTATHLKPVRVELTRKHASPRALERHFECPVVSGAARNAIVFRASDAALPFMTSNADLLATLAPQLERELKENAGHESFPELVRRTIQRRLAGSRPKMQTIARELGLSTRTLQRRLQEAEYSFQKVMEEARHQLARHYLNNSVLELTETAYLLGFEDANSFVRAFRMWEGVPPAHWREMQRGGVSDVCAG